MRYLLAILLPPLGMLTVGKPFQALLCLILMVTLIGWPLAAIWAVLVVNASFADSRNKRAMAEMRKQRAKWPLQTGLDGHTPIAAATSAHVRTSTPSSRRR